MRPSFVPRLVNGPLDDPALFIPFLFQHRAVIFDLGDLKNLSARDALKTSHVFVSHTHMDHFVGFDRLLRLFLGRDQTLHFFGPEGFLKNVEGKLAGYSWDLVQNYDTQLTLKVAEVTPDSVRRCVYRCQRAFAHESDPVIEPWHEALVEEPAVTISAVVLDHSVPCLGLKISERFHVNIRKERLTAKGLRPGPWLQHFKQALYRKDPPDTTVEAEAAGGGRIRFPIGELESDIAVITAGQQACYVTDVRYTAANTSKIILFAAGVDHLFMEAAFLEEDKQIAGTKNHLTARQAGEIAGKAQAKMFTPFHYSPRYQGRTHLLEIEAQNAYREALDANRSD